MNKYHVRAHNRRVDRQTRRHFLNFLARLDPKHDVMKVVCASTRNRKGGRKFPLGFPGRCEQYVREHLPTIAAMRAKKAAGPQ